MAISFRNKPSLNNVSRLFSIFAIFIKKFGHDGKYVNPMQLVFRRINFLLVVFWSGANDISEVVAV